MTREDHPANPAMALGKLKARKKLIRHLITICAWCNKIPDREGLWQQPETDLQADRGAEFSHGICPECAERSYNACLAGIIGVNAAIPFDTRKARVPDGKIRRPIKIGHPTLEVMTSSATS